MFMFVHDHDQEKEFEFESRKLLDVDRRLIFVHVVSHDDGSISGCMQKIHAHMHSYARTCNVHVHMHWHGAAWKCPE